MIICPFKPDVLLPDYSAIAYCQACGNRCPLYASLCALNDTQLSTIISRLNEIKEEHEK